MGVDPPTPEQLQEGESNATPNPVVTVAPSIPKPPGPGQNSSNTTAVFDLTIWQRQDVENKLRATFGYNVGWYMSG